MAAMEILHWDDALRVGVVQIDNEHRLICGLINDLLKVAEAGPTIQAQVLERSWTKLLDAIERHFASEEQLLDDAGYPELLAHRQQHRDLVEQLDRYRSKGALMVNSEMVAFLRHWFQHHLQTEDQIYATFLNAR